MAEYSVEQFESIYHAYKYDVKRVSKKLVHDDDTAEEITQIVFVKLFTQVTVIDESTVRALLLRIASNESMRFLRRQNRFYPIDDEWYDTESILVSEPLEEEYIRKLQGIDTDTFYANVMTALRIHNSEWYDVIFAIYYLGLPREEVAERLGIEISVLYGRVKRAKKWMRKCFKNDYDDMIDWDE